MNYAALSASDGNGEAVRATVQAARSVSSTSLTVDHTTHWPTGTFIATTGTLLSTGKLDPTTVQVFYGTASGTTITISSFAAGYTDLGSAVGDVVVVKPSTEWANIVDTTLVDLTQGWVNANETWAYASATTITVPTDATAKYDVGDYIKITQSATVEYFVVTAVASTLLTVSGLAGVTVANSPITANYYSKARSPHGAGLKGGAPYNPYKFSVYRAAAWSLTGGNQKVLLDTKNFDTGTNFDVVTNNRFVAPVAGFYFFTGNLNVGLTSGNVYSAFLYKNGSPVRQAEGYQATGSTFDQGATVSGLFQLAANDYIELWAEGTGSGTTGQSTSLDGFLVSAT